MVRNLRHRIFRARKLGQWKQRAKVAEIVNQKSSEPIA
nr:hypothetical protein [Okeania sp. SIO2C9]